MLDLDDTCLSSGDEDQATEHHFIGSVQGEDEDDYFSDKAPEEADMTGWPNYVSEHTDDVEVCENLPQSVAEGCGDGSFGKDIPAETAELSSHTPSVKEGDVLADVSDLADLSASSESEKPLECDLEKVMVSGKGRNKHKSEAAEAPQGRGRGGNPMVQATEEGYENTKTGESSEQRNIRLTKISNDLEKYMNAGFGPETAFTAVLGKQPSGPGTSQQQKSPNERPKDNPGKKKRSREMQLSKKQVDTSRTKISELCS